MRAGVHFPETECVFSILTLQSMHHDRPGNDYVLRLAEAKIVNRSTAGVAPFLRKLYKSDSICDSTLRARFSTKKDLAATVRCG
jgi:hypothetical protein